jgi:hypothetical protein
VLREEGEYMPSSRTSIIAIVGFSERGCSSRRAERVDADMRGRVPIVVIIGDIEFSSIRVFLICLCACVLVEDLVNAATSALTVAANLTRIWSEIPKAGLDDLGY